MIDGLYNTDVLSLAANIQHIGSLDEPEGTSRKVSKLCGSWIEVDTNVEKHVVSQFAMRVQACALGQASAAILAEAVIGTGLKELKLAQEALLKMLKENGEPPRGRFAKLKLLAEVANYPARHTSTMLAFDAAVDAFEKANT